MIDFFLNRPIFSISVSIFIVISGLVCFKSLPLAQYPNITPPVVLVSATLPGATAQAISDAVAAPIEKSINGVENMIYMFSDCATPGYMHLNVYFKPGSDPNLALLNTQSRVNFALPSLPEEVRNQGIEVQKAIPSVLLFAAVLDRTNRYDELFVINYATLNIADELVRVPGVSEANIVNSSDYSMRIWLKPERLAQFGLTTNEVSAAIRSENSLHAIGEIGQEPTPSSTVLTVPVSAQGRFSEASQFENILLKANSDGAAVFLKDVGRVELGSKSYDSFATLNKEKGAFIAIYQDSGSNALDVAKRVKERLAELQPFFPPGITYEIPYDTTKYIGLSIEEVAITIVQAAILVSLIILVFLHSFRAALIPMIAMIVSIIGTFIGIYALGFSVNTLGLFGMVLAVGIVVDDAIVVVENIEYNIRVLGLSSKEAAHKTMHTMLGPIIGIVCALGSVFIPVAFVGGIPGQFYKQFALTIVISVIISGFVALTLTPALAILFFKNIRPPSRFAHRFNQWFSHLGEIYLRGLDWLMGKRAFATGLYAAVLGAIGLLLYCVPLGFIPDEDQGVVLISADLPDGASISRVQQVSSQIEEIVRESVAVESVLAVSGYSLQSSIVRNNMGAYYIPLRDWHLRRGKGLSAADLIEQWNERLSEIPEANIIAVSPPLLPGVGVVGGFDFWVLNQGDATMEQLEQVVKSILKKAEKNPLFSSFITSIKADCMALSVEVDNVKAAAFGVPLQEIYDSLHMLLGSVHIGDFNRYGKIFDVVAQAEPSARNSPYDIGNIYVRSQSGQMVPLGALITHKFSKEPTLVSRFNGFPAALISVIPAGNPDQVIAEMEAIATEFLLPGMSFSWGGLAYQEKTMGGVSPLPLLAGLLMLFLVLAALYEKWTLPFIILFAVPFGILGALLAIWVRNLSIDIYFQIGLIALIGLSAKNVILIVEFARIQMAEGRGIAEAAREAAKLRMRAILMTSLTLILGVCPLIFSAGAGAASRHSLGTGVIGGMIFATLLALFFVPLFFQWIQEWQARRES
jgi:hydrophobe/amphiphile efflux-1 (HAE1) family protein